MIAVNYSTVRDNFKAYCDKVNKENETLIVTRKNNENVVIISECEYNIIQKELEKAKNKQYLDKILKSIKQIEDGKIVKKKLEELD